MSTFFSYAKINLGLQVLNRRNDGYHNIHSLILEIDLFDKIIINQSNKFELSVEGPEYCSFPLDQTNLIYKAYNLFKTLNPIEINYKIHVIKNIPLGAGLGGGSSNAAAILLALNRLHGNQFSSKKLESISKSLGSDVPFFIKGKLQLVEGVGEILLSLENNVFQELFFILVIPKIHISTQWAYKKLNKSLQYKNKRPKFSPISKPMNWKLFENDFERVIHETYPEIGQIKAALQDAGALYAGLSGSGSTVFGVFDNHQKAKLILDIFSQYQTFLTTPVFHT